MTRKFLDYFHSQEGINPAKTDRVLIDKLFNCYENRVSHTHYHQRASGATTTIEQFLMFCADDSILTCSHNHHSWLQLRGSHSQCKLIIFDDSLTIDQYQSVTMSTKFDLVRLRLRCPYINIIGQQ